MGVGGTAVVAQRGIENGGEGNGGNEVGRAQCESRDPAKAIMPEQVEAVACDCARCKLPEL